MTTDTQAAGTDFIADVCAELNIPIILAVEHEVRRRLGDRVTPEVSREAQRRAIELEAHGVRRAQLVRQCVAWALTQPTTEGQP